MNKRKQLKKVPEILTWATGWMPLTGEYKKRNRMGEEMRQKGFGWAGFFNLF